MIKTKPNFALCTAAVFVFIGLVGISPEFAQSPANLAKTVNAPNSWVLQTQGSSRAKLSKDKTSLKIAVKAVDGTNWHVQLCEILPSLTAGKTYAVAFEARSDSPRNILMAAAVYGGDYHDIGLRRESFALDTHWQWFRRTFVATGSEELPNRVPYFIVGDRVGTIWIRHAIVRQIADSAPEQSPVMAEATAASVEPIPAALPRADHAMYLNNIPSDALGPASPNLLKSLTDMSSWKLDITAPASATASLEGDAVKVRIANSDSINWHTRIQIPINGLHEGTQYILTGQVKSENPDPFDVYLGLKAGGNRSLGVAQSLTPRPEWRSFRYVFVANGTIDQDVILNLFLGKFTGQVWVRRLELRAETEVQAAARAAFIDHTDTTGRWPINRYQTYADTTPDRCRYLIAPIRFANTRDKFGETIAYFNRLFSDEWPGMGHYWRSVSYGHVHVEGKSVDWIDLPGNWQDYCETVVMPSAPNGAKAFNIQRLADEVAKRYSLDGFDALALFPNIRDDRPIAGASSVTLNGKNYPTVYVPDFGIKTHVLAHEIGHAFGFDHPYGNWTKDKNDRWDVMGAGGSWSNRHLIFGAIPGETNAYHKIAAGWIAESQIVRLGPGMERTFHLDRLEEPDHPQTLAAVLTPAGANGRYWTLEARMKVGYDLGCIPLEGVVCHECVPGRKDPSVTQYGLTLPGVAGPVDTDGNDNVNDAGVAWDVGKTYTNQQYHFSVNVVSRDASGWTVHVKVDP